MNANAKVACVEAATLTAPNLRHGFFMRAGGVSTGLYASLNCGYGSSDSAEAVRENRARVAAHLGAEPDYLVTLRQTHSAIAKILTGAPPAGAVIEADAIVTAQRGLAVAVLTADCAPVLFADLQAGVVAAAHAGWRGALGGILEQTVKAMSAIGAQPERIVAVVGPCISAPSYEVGDDFKATFLAKAPEYATFFSNDFGPKPHFDLPRFVRRRLEALNIGRVDILDHCTLLNESKFFSYRRSQQRGEPDYGRQISAILVR